MAAIDPTEEPEFETEGDKLKPRATLKVVRVAEDMFDDEDDSELDGDELDDMEDEEDLDGEEVNGGPSEKKPKSKDVEDEDEDEDEDDEDDEDGVLDAAAEALLKKIMVGGGKGKNRALELDDEDSDEDDEDLEGLGMDECVLCTLDPEKVCQELYAYSASAN